MAKKKTSAVAYVPLGQPQLDSTLSQIQLKVIPPYPDEGVAYAKYSKKPIGNNDYELKPQQVKTAIVRIESTTNPYNSNIILNGKKFYLTDIICSSVDDSGLSAPYPLYVSVGVRVGVAGTFTSFFQFPYLNFANSGSHQVISLKNPIEMFGSDPNLDLIAVQDTIGGGAQLRITLVGWLE